MNWLTIAWSMCAGIYVTLSLIHAVLWYNIRDKLAYLLSAIMALSAGAVAITELSLLHTDSINTYQLLLQWSNVFVYLLVIPMVWLVQVRLDRDHKLRKLAIIITVIWCIAVFFNFASPGSLVYTHVTEIKQLATFWGEFYNVGYGPANPWVLLANIDVLIILVYTGLASKSAWHEGEQRRAIIIGGGIIVFLIIGGAHAMLVDAGVVATPYMVSFAYLAIVLAMSYELVFDVLRVPQLTRTVEANQKRWSDLLTNVQLAVIAVNPKGQIT